ncbi:hypothetical protein G6699_07310 [Polynucleobacter paneuropaeus]|jgi:hypothetical protein|nr:hypothetical protein [Polynucleobacter paneuropaeus]
MKKLLLLVLFLFSSLTYGSEIQDFDFYLSPSNIRWTENKLPKEVMDSKVYKEWTKNFSENYTVRWSPIHLTSKDSTEVIIQEVSGGTGGTGGINTTVLQYNGKSWRRLVDIFGGFIFFNVPSKSNTLIIYGRMGYQYSIYELKLVGNVYKKISVRDIPTEVSDKNGQDDMFNYFWYMNNGFYPPRREKKK